MSLRRIVVSLVFSSVASIALAASQSTAFTYQGRLLQNGAPTSGSHNLSFSLWDASSGGNQVGSTISQSNYPVANGVFTIDLDFGVGVFNGQQRWLQVSVDSNTLSPRQPVNSTPVAQYALAAASGGASVVGSTSNNQFFNDHLYTGVGVSGNGAPMVVITSPALNPAGTSTLKGYAGGSDVYSMTSAMHISVDFSGQTAPPTLDDARLLVNLDKAYLDVLTHLISGTPYDKLQVDVLSSGATPKAVQSYCYKSVFVTELQPMPQAGVYEMTITPQIAGVRAVIDSNAGTTASTGYDLELQKVTSAPCIQ